MDKFEHIYNDAVTKCVPTKEVSSNGRLKPPWMSRAALSKVKRKYSRWITYLNTKQGRDYQEYIKCRNEASKAIRKSRREFEKALAKQCRKNSKGIWKYMKTSNVMKSTIPHLQNPDGTLTKTDQEICEVLSQQYQNAFTT